MRLCAAAVTPLLPQGISHILLQCRYTERFLSILNDYFSVPMLTLPGNHDVLHAMQEAGMSMNPIIWEDWHLQGLDSHEDDRPKALVTELDRRAVAQGLAQGAARLGAVGNPSPLSCR